MKILYSYIIEFYDGVGGNRKFLVEDVESEFEAKKIFYKQNSHAVIKSIIKQENIKLEGVVVEKGSIHNGSKISENCEIQGDVDKLFVEKDFMATSDPNYIIGELTHCNKKLPMVTDMNIYKIDDKILKFFTPAIGGKIIKSHDEGDVRVIDEFELTSVSLNSSPNADPSIKSIGEQIETK